MTVKLSAYIWKSSIGAGSSVGEKYHVCEETWLIHFCSLIVTSKRLSSVFVSKEILCSLCLTEKWNYSITQNARKASMYITVIPSGPSLYAEM